MNAAYLYAQLEAADEINSSRLAAWQTYYNALMPVAEAGFIKLPVVPEGCIHNAHMFYIITANIDERTALMAHLREKEIQSVFHYVPLHSAPAGKKFGRFSGEDRYTTSMSERLLRLPMHYGLTVEQARCVASAVAEFYGIKV